jgi:hypothetical protein
MVGFADLSRGPPCAQGRFRPHTEPKTIVNEPSALDRLLCSTEPAERGPSKG